MGIVEGDKRIIRRFPLVPLIIGNEMRWLEWVFIVQEARKVMRYAYRLADLDQNPVYSMEWFNLVFAEKS